jgi:hypothetical protein
LIDRSRRSGRSIYPYEFFVFGFLFVIGRLGLCNFTVLFVLGGGFSASLSFFQNPLPFIFGLAT